MSIHWIAFVRQKGRRWTLAALACLGMLASWSPAAALEAKKPAKPKKPDTSASPATSSGNIVTTSGLMVTHRQIVIEGLVVEVDSSEARRWGLEMFYERNPANVNGGGNLAAGVLSAPNSFPLAGVPVLNSNVDPPEVNISQQPIGIGGTFDGFQTDTWVFQTRVRAAVIKGKANILSQPIAVARTGTEVILSTVDEIPFQDIVTEGYHVTTIPKNDNHLASVQSDFTNKKAGITLKVTPNLSPPERIDLKVTQLEVGQLAGFVHVRGVSRPVIEHSVLSTEVQLGNHESLLVSGIKTTREQVEKRGVPYLKDLPVLGLLFGSTTVLTDRVDIMFLITPHLLMPGQNPSAPREFKNREFLLNP